MFKKMLVLMVLALGLTASAGAVAGDPIPHCYPCS